MSIETIKEGKFSTRYVSKCKSCDSIFTFKMNDMSYSIEAETYYMYCPECGHRETYKQELLEEYDTNKKY